MQRTNSGRSIGPTIWLTVGVFVAAGTLILVTRMGPEVLIPVASLIAVGAMFAIPIVPDRLRRSGTNPGFVFNVAVIVTGALIAIIGLGVWAIAQPDNSAFRQTVAALLFTNDELTFIQRLQQSG